MTIRLSLSGGSGVSIKELLLCPKKVKLYMDGWRQKYTPLPLVEGALFHSNGNKILNGKDVSTEAVQKEILSGYFVDDQDREVIWDTEKKEKETSKETLVQQAARRLPGMINKVKERKEAGDFGNIKSTEKLIVVEKLVNPVSDKENANIKRFYDEGIEFAGRMDIETDDHIADMKTSKAGWIQDQADNEQQLSNYLYMKTVIDGELWDKAVIHSFSKHMTECRYARLETKRQTEDYVHAYELFENAGLLYLESKAGGWKRRGPLTGCQDTYFRKCPYHPICFAHRYSDDARKEAMSEIFQRNG